LTPAAGGQSLFYAGDTTVSPRGGIVFGDAGDDKLSINGVPFNSTTLVLSLETTAQYRDPSAWYHLVVSLDTTQATASDRCKMYVNGVQVTAFGTATYPSLNQELQYNDAILHATRHPSGDYKFVGYLADTYFVDGTALDPTSFGEFKNGVWIPKAYTGSYGTNGFHLEYDGNANDSSGTGNNWTATNIVAGDYMLDSPTNNYATLNPLNFGQSGFTYTPPAGFLALSTANLPEPSISPLYGASPQDHFNTVLYTGNDVSNAVTGVGFQPDFVWMKNRASTYYHGLYDVVRGTGTSKSLYSNTTEAEGTNSTNQNLVSFDSDGFTLGSTSSTNVINTNGEAHVAWNWKASNATAVSNTEGTITSQVSANTTAGFSIVSYTGTGSAATVGHGLGVAPEMMILNHRSNT
jgi:hypothetical protein